MFDNESKKNNRWRKHKIMREKTKAKKRGAITLLKERKCAEVMWGVVLFSALWLFFYLVVNLKLLLNSEGAYSVT